MIDVRERGETLLTPKEWEAISNDPSFASLVDKSILSAEPARRQSGWRLKAGAYVGRATLGGIDVNIVEKVPGATNALLSALAPRSFQLTQATMRESLAGRPDAMIASMLIASTRTYLSHGGEAEYRNEHLTGAYVTGRLDVRRTAGLRARGVRHRVAFSRNVLDDDTPLNRSIFGALGVLATPGASSEFGVHVTAAARALRSSFGLSAKTSLMMSRSELREEAAHVAEAKTFRRESSAQEAGVLASAVLEGAAFVGESGTRLIPRSWFVNLEELFERLIRKLVSDLLGEEAKVASAAEWPGRARPPPLFPDHSKRYASNPDLVILRKGCLAIGDAKYKDFETWPSASDIYQLMVHFVRGGKLAELLNDARSAVTVNSTAGQQALWRGLPLRCFGTAVYAQPEFVSTQPIDAFFAAPDRPDSRAYRSYRQYLLETSQIVGGFYSARGRRALLRQVVDLMLAEHDPYEALYAGTAAPRQQLRLVT